MQETLYFVHIFDGLLHASKVVINAQPGERDSIIRDLGMGTPVSHATARKAVLLDGAINEGVEVQ